MNKFIKIIITLWFSLLMGACAHSPFTGDRVSTLNAGDDIDKVISVVGKPDGFETTKDNIVIYKYLNRYISGWGNNTTDYYLFFQNKKLISIKNGIVTNNTAHIQNSLNSLNQQLEYQKQREHETRINLMNNINSNKVQKIIICKPGDLLCY